MRSFVTKHMFHVILERCQPAGYIISQLHSKQMPALQHKLLTLSLVCSRSTGNINELAEDNKQHVKLFNCNFDFTYAEHFHTPRFGPGAFIQLLDVLFHESTGRHIEIIRHGKFITFSCNPATTSTPLKSETGPLMAVRQCTSHRKIQSDNTYLWVMVDSTYLQVDWTNHIKMVKPHP